MIKNNTLNTYIIYKNIKILFKFIYNNKNHHLIANNENINYDKCECLINELKIKNDEYLCVVFDNINNNTNNNSFNNSFNNIIKWALVNNHMNVLDLLFNLDKIVLDMSSL